MIRGFSRRRFMTVSAAVTGVATLDVAGTLRPAAAADRAGDWSGGHSENGWPVLDTAQSFDIEGSDQKVPLAGADAAAALTHVARRFHYEIDSLRDGDVHGWTKDHAVTQAYESNHLSGSAIAVRPLCYPAGSRGNLYPNELVVVRDILAELDGVVAWGGDFKTPKESHFEIATTPGHPKLKGVARKIRRWNSGPGSEGAGATDAFNPERRSAARSLRTG
ncbi:hypothetical protein AB0H77_34520 [Streptomyces sp. NPDC050844]|uniref:hypothetical protein n=1 Tax=Streptomyces sp. NPDC050844 TaxID=3155790 RepID=UPI0033FB1EA9